MKLNNITEQERNYITETNTYTDTSANVFYSTIGSASFVIAKPIKGSKRGYTFDFSMDRYDEFAIKFAKDLFDGSKGFDIRIKWNKNNAVVVAKPVSAEAELVIPENDFGKAIKCVEELRAQEIKNKHAFENQPKAEPKMSTFERQGRKMQRLIADLANESKEVSADGDFTVAQNIRGINKRESLSKAAGIYNGEGKSL